MFLVFFGYNYLSIATLKNRTNFPKNLQNVKKTYLGQAVR